MHLVLFTDIVSPKYHIVNRPYVCLLIDIIPHSGIIGPMRNRCKDDGERGVMMEDTWVAARDQLRRLRAAHPEWTLRELAAAVGRSLGWVQKWLRRFQDAEPDDDSVLYSQSRAPKHAPLAISLAVMVAILTIRLHPPHNLGRTPGPKAILYYLQQDPSLEGERIPQSTRTVYKVLKAAKLIDTPEPRQRKPWELPEPLTVWELDLCAVSRADGLPTQWASVGKDTLRTSDPR